MTEWEVEWLLRQAMHVVAYRDGIVVEVPHGNVARHWHSRGIAVAGVICQRLADIVAMRANAMNSEYDDPGPLHAQVDALRQAAEVLGLAARNKNGPPRSSSGGTGRYLIPPNQ
jgi:hypothetical protein